MPAKINLSQTYLYTQFDAYLKKIGSIEGQARDNNLNSGGDCAGWSFLFGYYNNINKGQEFTEIQSYISNWDKNIISLLNNNGMSDTLKNKYSNGIKLFEQTINDVAWFSQIKSKIFAHNQLSQDDRIKQFDYVADSKHELQNIFSFLKKNDTNITQEELPDMLRIAQQWENSWLDLGVYAHLDNKNTSHALSVYISPNGTYTYFDCNSADKPFETNSPEIVSQKIFSAFNGFNAGYLKLNDFSLYQLTSNTIENSHKSVSLDISENVGGKFLEMALNSHQLDPIYKLLSADNKNSGELIKTYGTPLFQEAIDKGHSGMAELLIKHDPGLAAIQMSDLLNWNGLHTKLASAFWQNDMLELGASTEQVAPLPMMNLPGSFEVDLIHQPILAQAII